MDKRSKILQIARYLETGSYSRNKLAETLHVSRNLVTTVMEVIRRYVWLSN